MEISFSSKKEESQDESSKKIEFARKLEPTLGSEKKSNSAELKTEQFDDDVLEDEKKSKEDFLSRFLDNFKNFLLKKDKQDDGGVLEVNLVKREIVKFFDWQRAVLLVFLAIFSSIAILSFSYWGISWWGDKKQNAEDSAYQQEYYKVNKEIKELEGDVNNVLKFKNQLDLSNYLLDHHIYWSNFFNFLEDNTLSNVNFSSFSGDIGGNYHLSATTNNFDVINIQTKKFSNNSFVEGAVVNAGTIGNDGDKTVVSFSLSLLLNPEIFFNK